MMMLASLARSPRRSITHPLYLFARRLSEKIQAQDTPGPSYAAHLIGEERIDFTLVRETLGKRGKLETLLRIKGGKGKSFLALYVDPETTKALVAEKTLIISESETHVTPEKELATTETRFTISPAPYVQRSEPTTKARRHERLVVPRVGERPGERRNPPIERIRERIPPNPCVQINIPRKRCVKKDDVHQLINPLGLTICEPMYISNQSAYVTFFSQEDADKFVEAAWAGEGLRVKGCKRVWVNYLREGYGQYVGPIRPIRPRIVSF